MFSEFLLASSCKPHICCGPKKRKIMSFSSNTWNNSRGKRNWDIKNETAGKSDFYTVLDLRCLCDNKPPPVSSRHPLPFPWQRRTLPRVFWTPWDKSDALRRHGWRRHCAFSCPAGCDPRLPVLRDSVRDETVPRCARPSRPGSSGRQGRLRRWAPPAGRGAEVIQSGGVVLQIKSAGSALFGQIRYHMRAHFLWCYSGGTKVNKLTRQVL